MTSQDPTRPMGYDSRIADFFDRFPSARGIYAADLFHLTHSMNVPGIMRTGLHGNAELFPADHGQFLLDICRKYSPSAPSDGAHIEDRIIYPADIYLTRSLVNDLGEVGYGVPERLMLLMRSLFALSQKGSLTDGERTFAQEAFESHKTRLTTGEPTITRLGVDPFAPAIMHARLGASAVILAETTDPDDADMLMQYVDGNYGNNIAVVEAIEPVYIRIDGTMPVTEERLLRGVYHDSDWVSRLP